MSKIKTARTLAIAAYGVWKKLPKKQKQQAMELVRKHGPTIAKQAAKARAGAKKTK
jgi:hypothetical protein